MESSVRDAKARFSEALEAAARGERVVVTKHGKPFVQLVPAKAGEPEPEEDFWARLERVRRKFGLENVRTDLPDHFNETWYGRQALGLDPEE